MEKSLLNNDDFVIKDKKEELNKEDEEDLDIPIIDLYLHIVVII